MFSLLHVYLYNLHSCHKLYCLMIIQFWIWISIKKTKQTNKQKTKCVIQFISFILYHFCTFNVFLAWNVKIPRQIWYNVIVRNVFFYRRTNAYKNIFVYTYYYIPFLNDQSLHHWQKLCKSNWRRKSVSTSNMCQSSSCPSNYLHVYNS
jgi:hypothetical protein